VDHETMTGLILFIVAAQLLLSIVLGFWRRGP
jgi:hypothetical protein